MLIKYDLKDGIRLIASGKLVTPSDVAWALCAGADFINSARGFMFAMGCIQVLKCQMNTCPTGIATHNPRLQKGLNPANKAVKVAELCEKFGPPEIRSDCSFLWCTRTKVIEAESRANHAGK